MLKFLIFLSICLATPAFGSTRPDANQHLVPTLEEFDIEQGVKGTASKNGVKLLPHQQKPIQYLKAHPEVRGLIVNHGLGTGKTYLALGFAEQYPDRNVILLIPDSLVSNWAIQMQDYGIKKNTRYEIIKFSEAPQKLIARDLSKTLVIVDEAHKLFTSLRSPVAGVSDAYTRVYLNLRSSSRLLLLTGTPIFTDVADIGLLINLVADDKELLPYNGEQFRNQYTAVEGDKSFWRGHFNESMLTKALTPTFVLMGTIFLIPYTLPIAIGAYGGGLLNSGLNSYFSVQEGKVLLRKFNLDKMDHLASKYVSYYQIGELSKEMFPTTSMSIQDVPYSVSQLELYTDYIDRRLSQKDLNKILIDVEPKALEHPELVNLKSSYIQEDLNRYPGSGREIGNFMTPKEGGEGFSPKFLAVYQAMLKSDGPIVVYSNYFNNGVKLFAKFLEHTPFKQSYRILDYRDHLDVQVQTIRDYNQGKVKILLLHPEFTEGISLHGTRQLHILEPVLSSPLYKQIAGRVVRYKSHMQLPADKRHVDIFVWRSTVNKWTNWDHYTTLKRNWQRYYLELNDWSDWGLGINQVDPRASLKRTAPDEVVYKNFYLLDQYIEGINSLFQQKSIEVSQL